jgi:hypothetical protein
MMFAQVWITASFQGQLRQSSTAQLSSLLIKFYGEKMLHLLCVAVFRYAHPAINKHLLYQNSPEGDGRCRILLMPGDGARRGGVALPRPESVSVYLYTILSWSVLDPVFYKQLHIDNYTSISQPQCTTL